MEEDMMSEAKVAFLEGYRKVCVFTKEQADTLPLMKRLVGIQSLNNKKPRKHEVFSQLPGGFEPPTYALRMRCATSCATEAIL